MILKLLLVTSLLFGNISNESGRLGIRVSSGSDKITHVYDTSNAKGLLYEDDIIVSCDGRKGTEFVTGCPGTFCHLTIKRGDKILKFEIVRVPWRDVKDVKN